MKQKPLQLRRDYYEEGRLVSQVTMGSYWSYNGKELILAAEAGASINVGWEWKV